MLESKPRAQSFQNLHCNLVLWSPSSVLSPPLLGTIILRAPKEFSPEEQNQPPPKVTTLGRGTAQSSPASLSQTRQTAASPACFERPRDGKGPSPVTQLPLPLITLSLLAPSQDLVPPSTDFRGSALPSKQLSEHHYFSPLRPEAKPLSVEESRVLSLSLETTSSLHVGRQGQSSTHLACLGPGPA